jgi:hypothetical protein
MLSPPKSPPLMSGVHSLRRPEEERRLFSLSVRSIRLHVDVWRATAASTLAPPTHGVCAPASLFSLSLCACAGAELRGTVKPCTGARISKSQTQREPATQHTCGADSCGLVVPLTGRMHARFVSNV